MTPFPFIPFCPGNTFLNIYAYILFARRHKKPDWRWCFSQTGGQTTSLSACECRLLAKSSHKSCTFMLCRWPFAALRGPLVARRRCLFHSHQGGRTRHRVKSPPHSTLSIFHPGKIGQALHRHLLSTCWVKCSSGRSRPGSLH